MVILDRLMFAARWKNWVFLSPSLHQVCLDFCRHIASTFLLTDHWSDTTFWSMEGSDRVRTLFLPLIPKPSVLTEYPPISCLDCHRQFYSNVGYNSQASFQKSSMSFIKLGWDFQQLKNREGFHPQSCVHSHKIIWQWSDNPPGKRVKVTFGKCKWQRGEAEALSIRPHRFIEWGEWMKMRFLLFLFS